MIIYAVKNKIKNRDVYVGMTKYTMKKRKSQHLKMLEKNEHANDVFQNSYNKYGDVFEWRVVANNIKTQKQAKIEETKYIKTLKTYVEDGGYNLVLEDPIRIPSKETREKISKGNKGKVMPLHAKKKISTAMSIIMIGNQHNLGKPRLKETREKISKSHIGMKHTEQSKIKIRAARKRQFPEPRKGLKLTSGHKSKISESKKGQRHTKEAKEKIRQASINMWQERKLKLKT